MTEHLEPDPGALTPPSQLVDPLIDAKVADRYRIRGVLGNGGMGVVYDAYHEELGREVAIKVLARGVIGPSENATSRFYREARAATSVGHPNVIDIFDVGTLPDGRPFLVMPFLDGQDLGEIVERAPLPLARVIELLEPVASALDSMHALGLVHRDIKPENLMVVTIPGGKETVKILDFGLAALFTPDATRITDQGALSGTPAYLPPEAASGDLVDGRGDVYSLAVVAFELLTGKLPFDGPTPFSVLSQKVSQPPPSLSSVSDQSFSDQLEAVLSRGLATDPKDRFASAEELTGGLRMVLEGKPLTSELSAPASMAQPLALGEPEPKGSAGSCGDDSPSAPLARLRSIGPPLARISIGLFLPILTAIAVAVALAAAQSRDNGVPRGVRTPEMIAATTEAMAVPITPEVVRCDDADPAGEPTPASLLAEGPGEDREATGDEEAAPERAEEGEATPAKNDEGAAEAERDRLRRERRLRWRARARRARRAREDQGAAGLTRRAMSLLIQGLLAESTGVFHEAIRSDPDYGPAWRGLGLAYERLGRNEAAVRAYTRYLQASPGSPDASRVRRRVRALMSRIDGESQISVNEPARLRGAEQR